MGIAVDRRGVATDRGARRALYGLAAVGTLASALVYLDKAGDDRSAFVRWRHQVLQFWDGVNIYEGMSFPNPPIFPITLYPFARLPAVGGAAVWYLFKVALTVLSIGLCFRMARPTGDPPLRSWIQGTVLLLSVRPILSDLHHANNNLLILALIVLALESWRRGYDALSGLVLALAISYKVTPALFVAYFLARRSWRTVGATAVGVALALIIVPSLVVGPEFNAACLAAWWRRMLSPFLEHGFISPQEVNQSLGGVLTRLLTTLPGAGRMRGVAPDVHLADWSPVIVDILIKGLSLGFVGLLPLLCRTDAKRREDPRLLGEFALVALTMLFVSERSWKHHYVTLLLPYTYLTYRVGRSSTSGLARVLLGAALGSSSLLMAATSAELGGWFANGQGHKLAQGYGMFFWSGLVLYLATGCRVWLEKDDHSADIAEVGPVSPGRSSLAPHWAG